jgi:hypothetical protein
VLLLSRFGGLAQGYRVRVPIQETCHADRASNHHQIQVQAVEKTSRGTRVRMEDMLRLQISLFRCSVER